MSHFHHQGNSDDLNEAISLYEEVLCLCPVGHKYHHSTLGNLGAALYTHFNQCHDPSAQGTDIVPPGNPYCYYMLNNLAGTLQTRYEKLNTSEDLNKAINFYWDSLQLTLHGHPHHHTGLSNLGLALCFHFTQSQKNEEVEEAIQLSQELLEALPSLHPDRYFSYVWLMNAYLSCYRVQDKSVDLPLAVENFRLASQHPTQRLLERIGRAIEWIHQAEHEAATVFHGAQSLPVDAALCAIHCDDLQQAIKLVEQGHGFLWFLLPPLYGDLQAAAHHGPVVILIARRYDSASFMHPEEMRKELQVLLQTVWDEIMLPIVIVLQHNFRIMKNCATLSFVAIGQSSPGVGQGKALLTVNSKLGLICKLIPATVNPTTLSGNGAMRASALDALQCNTWVHLTCHGKQDHEQPYHSCFAMRDKPLMLLDIMEKDIPHAEFAFLLACHTAVGDEKMPNKVIHLTAGLQFSGFKNVIGMLWVVNDAVTKHVVKAFYKNMVKGLEDGDVMDCTKVAWVLNCATDAVKMKVPLKQRMVFIHISFQIVNFQSSFILLVYLS
ncbi:CHAT domain-containing protein [Suillus subaureus]|uniref:CHAT domain-containing protein n=1 Tax=Suillus subaureus TaxID=48587 RepID=A0A9P7JEM0_9AGAM|nr:CHAT domain-containing protein [Suillus subaureus]KAG1817989.1 CHAT domain-containing protein [Suillus subaureus]